MQSPENLTTKFPLPDTRSTAIVTSELERHPAVQHDSDCRPRTHARPAHDVDGRRGRGAVGAADERLCCIARTRRIARITIANAVQLSTLLSIKTGGCPEDCGYCPQAARYHTGVDNEELLPRARGCAPRRLGGQGGRSDALLHGRGVARSEGPRSRAGAGDGARGQGARPRNLRDARHAQGRPGRAAAATPGLDYYNHNLDTSPEFYGEIISTRDVSTIASTRSTACARRACTSAAAASSAWANRGAQRAGLIAQLANLDPYPESVPINNLVQVEGTPLHRRRSDRSVRVRAHDRGRAHHDAAGDGAPVGGPAASWATRRRRCAFSPVRIRFSMATSC